MPPAICVPEVGQATTTLELERKLTEELRRVLAMPEAHQRLREPEMQYAPTK